MLRFNRIADRAGGLVGLLLGCAALREAWKLYPFRTGLLSGDHVFPVLIGAALCLAGIYLLLLPPGRKGEQDRIRWPAGPDRWRLLYIPSILGGYAAVLLQAGYLFATWAAAFLLFRVVGMYKWLYCLLGAVVLTGALHLLFIEWLNTPLPSGRWWN